MISFIFALLLLALALATVVIRKTYYYLPFKELKRQAERNDPLAVQLYRAVAYGGSLRALLWLIIALASAGGFVLLIRVAPVWLGLIAVIVLLWVAFSWLPASRVTKFGARLTATVTPAMVWLLNYTHPLLGRGADRVQKRYSAPLHTGLYERTDLLELIKRQQKQEDSRVTTEELEIARRALTFGDYTVGDILTTRKAIKLVAADDTIGPILIDELHTFGQPYVLVSNGKSAKDIVGSLQVQQLGLKSSGKVRDYMSDTVYYLHEKDSLSEALHAFTVTNHPVFVVVNGHEEYVGIVTIEAILQQLLGHIPGDDFEQYSNRAAIAQRHSKAAEQARADALAAELAGEAATADESESLPETDETVVE